MATLNIRNLPPDVHARVRVRAARAGRSMEAEARVILARACAEPEARVPATSLQDLVTRLYGDRPPTDVVATLIAERRREGEAE